MKSQKNKEKFQALVFFISFVEHSSVSIHSTDFLTSEIVQQKYL